MAVVGRPKDGIGLNAPIERIPPHNIDAEQSLLGSMMISEEAISAVAEIVKIEDFYRQAHANVYEAILRLWSRGEPADPITVAEELKANGSLENVGGKPYIHTLVSVVPTAANAKYYAEIVERNAVLRHLISAATTIAGLGYETSDEVEQIIDRAESLIFSVSQKRISEKFTHIKELLAEGFEQIEKLYEKKAHVTGTATGFADLDHLTSGLHPSDLVVIAGRPSMGKCVAFDTEIVDPATGEVKTIEEIHRHKSASLFTLNKHLKLETTQPSVFVDDGIKPVFKVKTALGREIETTLPHPFLTIDGWKPLSELRIGDRIGVPRVIPTAGSYDMPEHEAKALAYFLADGGLTSANPRFTNGNKRIMNDFVDAVTRFTGIETNIENRNGPKTPTCCVSARVRGPSERARIKLLGERLKEALRETSLTQLQLAEQASISHGAVQLIANGHSVPTDATFAGICQVTAKPLDFFVEGGAHGVDSLRKNNAVTRWLREHQMMGKLAQDKVIPECVFRLTRERLALFLNRLFACDGSAYVNSLGSYGISYSSSSKRMIRQVQHLLLRFGIISKIRKKKISYNGDYRITYELSFHNSENILRFAAEIGMFGKEGSLKKLVEAAAGKKGIFTQDSIPKAVWAQVRDIKEQSGKTWSEVGKVRSFARSKDARPRVYKNVRRDTLRIYGDVLGSQKLIDLAESDVYWDTIVAIESMGNKQVYDLTVPETHNFVANDFLVHNTSFTLGIAQHIGLVEKTPVAIFSLEMSRQQLAQRLMCSEARVDAQSLRTGNLKDEDWPKLSNAVGRLAEAPIFIDDTANITIMEVRAKARRLMTKHKLGLIVVDYLQLMQGGLRSENRQQEVSEISRSLKILGRELNVPVIAVSQLSRAVEQRNDKRPLLADLRESGSIEQDADLVIFIYRDEYYRQDSEEKGIAEIIISKHRNGPTGIVKLAFLEHYTKFANLAKGM